MFLDNNIYEQQMILGAFLRIFDFFACKMKFCDIMGLEIFANITFQN